MQAHSNAGLPSFHAVPQFLIASPQSILQTVKNWGWDSETAVLCRLMCAESFCCSVGKVVCVLFQATLLVIKELLVCGVCIYMVCMGKGVMHVCDGSRGGSSAPNEPLWLRACHMNVSGTILETTKGLVCPNPSHSPNLIHVLRPEVGRRKSLVSPLFACCSLLVSATAPSLYQCESGAG